MLDVCLLGCGGMMPLPYRWLTSLMLRYNGSSFLVDCGEGTQIAMKEKGWSPKPIDVICLTHFHADHVSGLPGLLLAMGNADRTEPVTIIGPKGLERVIGAMRVIAPELPFEINCIEITQAAQSFEFGGLIINAFKVNHRITCYGYSFELKRAGRFSADRAKEQNIPLKLWNRLQKGETINEDGITYTPSMVLGEERKGLKLTYCTDTRPTDSIIDNARGADLFICEGMYGDLDKEANAREHRHMTFYEAAELAKKAGVMHLWLTHYSPSLTKPDPYMKDVKKIFKNSHAGYDGRSIELMFED